MLAGEVRAAGRLGRAGGEGSEKPACPSQEPLGNSLMCPWRPPSLGGSSRKKPGYGLAISLSPPGVPRALWSQGGSQHRSLRKAPGRSRLSQGSPRPGQNWQPQIRRAATQLHEAMMVSCSTLPTCPRASAPLAPDQSYSEYVSLYPSLCPAPPQTFGHEQPEPSWGFLDLYLAEGGTMGISKLRDESNSTPPPSPCPSASCHTCIYDHVHRCTHKHIHTRTRVCTHTGTYIHTCTCTHGHADTPR